MTTDPIRVMVAVDHFLISSGLKMMLSALDDMVMVGAARTGKEVLNLCEQTQVDVILIDLHIEDDGCVTTISNVHKRYPNIHVILLTHFDEYALIQQAISAGAASVLLKTTDKNDLATTIRRVHDAQQLLSMELLENFITDIQAKPVQPQEVGNDLTDREIEVLTLISHGYTNTHIGEEMHISRATVKTHVSSILSKLGVATRTEAAALAIQLQLVSVPMILDALTGEIPNLPEEHRERIATDIRRLRNSFITRQNLFDANQKLTSQALRENERVIQEANERFQILADSNPLLIWMTDAEGGNLFVNRTYRKFVGISSEQVERHQWQPYFHHEDGPAYIEAFQQSIRERQPFSAEARIQRADGTWRLIATYAEPRFAANGTFLGHVGNSMDITDSKQAEVELKEKMEALRQSEQALRISENLFHASIESLLSGFAILKPVREPNEGQTQGKIVDFRLEYVNEVGCQLAGLANYQMLGHTVLELFSDRSELSLLERFADVLETGRPLVERILFDRPDGKRGKIHQILDLRVIKNDDGLVLTGNDITEQVRAQQAMTEMEIQHRLMDQREKERQSFALDIHDGPVQSLSGISFSLQYLKETFPDPALLIRLDQIGLAVKEAIQGLRTMVNELGPPAAIHFGLTRAIEMNTEELRKRYPQIEWSFQLADDLQRLSEPVILALFRIYQEAVNNIIRHSEATRVWVIFQLTTDQAILEIRDNGKGFPANYDRMKFIQDKHFGLARMEERVRAIGGVLAITSMPGQGTTIHGTAPIAGKQEP